MDRINNAWKDNVGRRDVEVTTVYEKDGYYVSQKDPARDKPIFTSFYYPDCECKKSFASEESMEQFLKEKCKRG